MPTVHRIHRSQSHLAPSIPIHTTQQRLQNKVFPECEMPSLARDTMVAMSIDTIDAHQLRERLKTHREKECRVLHEDFVLPLQ